MSDRQASIDAFFSGLPFSGDRFQKEATKAFASGSSVVVTAPTGAGKTLVAEAAIYAVKQQGKRSFYTTPIKALSNQKFSDFRAEYGEAAVGLLTGDNVINGDAPIVVMTTEVLRNMIYADSRALDNLGVVVLDEVHYLQDRQRGSVWEEIIIHLPAEVPIVALSATVANAAEFTEWVGSRRGPTNLVIEEHRPVPLQSQYMLKDRNHGGAIEMLPVFDRLGVKANPDVVRMLKRSRGRYRRFSVPRRLEVVEELVRRDLAPLIYFIFSRAGVDQAAGLVADSGLALTSRDEREEIRAVAAARTAHLSPADLAVLGYSSWVETLERGVAPHHAGLVPAFKEAAEELFRDGLIRVVFATETLALGINMPARAVVIERLSKFTGETHELLQAGDYTQLTGRAGRRGIDEAGTAVVLYDHQVPFDKVVAIAAAGSHPLRSSFQPTYNMAVNLIANYARDRAEELLSASFAQYRLDRRREQFGAQADALRADLAELRNAAHSSFGDIWEYAASGAAADAKAILRDFVQETEPGDVFQLAAADEPWLLLARGYGANPRLLLVNESAETRRVGADELPTTVARIGTVPLPDPIRSRDTRYRRHAARMLRELTVDSEPIRPGLADGDHPVSRDPELAPKLQAVRRARRLEKDLARLERRQRTSSSGLVDEFERHLAMLEDLGYVSAWELTAKGERLRFVYNELDLLLAESVERGLFTDLGAADLAAIGALFTFEPRLGDEVGEWPTDQAAGRGEAIVDLAHELAAAERRLGLEPPRQVDPGFCTVAFDWAQGASLEELFEEDEARAGDFVRNMRQLLDLLRQLRDAYPELATAARLAVKQIDRGVVAAGGQV